MRSNVVVVVPPSKNASVPKANPGNPPLAGGELLPNNCRHPIREIPIAFPKHWTIQYRKSILTVLSSLSLVFLAC